MPCLANLFPYAIAKEVAPAPPFTGIKTSTKVLFPSLNLYAISPFTPSARTFNISLYIFSGFLNLFIVFILFFLSIKSLSDKYAILIFSLYIDKSSSIVSDTSIISMVLFPLLFSNESNEEKLSISILS